MKYYLYILLFFIFSCEEIQENVEALPYDFLISEAWINFESEDLDSAEDLFVEVLNSEDSMVPYYSAAYLGLGWTKLYQAKDLSGNSSDNFDDIYNLRSDARDYFVSVIEECNAQDEVADCENSEIPGELIFDAYAGLAYSYSLFGIYDDCSESINSECDGGEDRFSCIPDNQIYNTESECESNCEQYTTYTCSNNQIYYSTEDSCEEECSDGGECLLNVPLCLNMREAALEYSDILLDNNPSYYFMYDSDNINTNSMRILRAQLYINLGEYQLAEAEILAVDLTLSDITFTLLDSYEDIYDSYDRYLYIGFEGNNNSKNFIPMETNLLSYDCYYSCSSISDEENCVGGCEWLENEGCQELYDDMYVNYDSCEADCADGECKGSYSSSVTASFSPLLPCLYTYSEDVDINLSDEEIIQCLDSFPTNKLEYKFAIRFPASIIEGYTCTSNIEDDIFTIYYTEGECIDNCDSLGCQIVDFDYANCQSQTDLEFIDGIGCVDSYMYLMEEFDDNICLDDGYRSIEIEQGQGPISLESSFGLCLPN